MLNVVSITVQLWEATLSHAPSMVPQLLAYFPCLVKIMERNFDHLQVRNYDPAEHTSSVNFLGFFYSLTCLPLYVTLYSNLTLNLPTNGCLI